MKNLIFVICILFCGSSLFAAEEVAWMKFRTDIGMEEMINAVFSPDEKTIFATDANLKLIELSAETGEVIRVVPEFKGIIQFSDDGEYVYTYNFEKRKWPTGELIGQYPVPKYGFLKGGSDWNTTFKIHEKAGLLIGIIYVNPQYGKPWFKGLLVYDLNTFNFIDTLGLEFNYYYSITFSTDGKYFKTGSEYDPDKTYPGDDRTIYMFWDSKTLKPIKEDNVIANFKSSPDGKWLGSAGHPFVRVYDNKAFTENLSLIKIYEWDPNKGYCLSSGLDFTQDSKYMVTSGPGCQETVRPNIWDLEKGKLAYKYERLIGSNNLKFNKKNQIFVFTKEGFALLNWMVPSDVKESEQNNSIIYPNPTTNILSLQTSGLIMPEQIQIFDLKGQKINLESDKILIMNNEIQINVSNLEIGTYFLTVQNGSKQNTYKFIVGR